MCGRYNLRTNLAAVIQHFDIDSGQMQLPFRFNIAPTQTVPIVRLKGEGRELAEVRWGLVPSWSKEVKGRPLINARSETVHTKPSFRAAFKRRRCIVPASGFYEWKRNGKEKQPYHIRLKNDGLIGFAGLWERWKSPGGETVESCTIITTEPNEVVAPLHDRMPAFLHPQDYSYWLTAGEDENDGLRKLLTFFPADQMTATPVSDTVNSAKNESPQCLEPVD